MTLRELLQEAVHNYIEAEQPDNDRHISRDIVQRSLAHYDTITIEQINITRITIM